MPMFHSTRSQLANLTRASVVALAAVGVVAAPLAAESAAIAPRAASQASDTVYVPALELSQFRPADTRKEHTIDYSYLDKALKWFVIPMGRSLRQTAPIAEQRLGTRRIYGHTSRYRLEGSRVAFSFFDDDIRASLTEYRQDLERVGSDLDIPSLPRNEQLAFWLNLHNVAVIEAIAKEYPLSQPAAQTFGLNEAPLDDAKLVTVAGVDLSPRDIRERIVYPNWTDPKVIYGFWRGEIGGPTLQRLAFSADNVDTLLSLSSAEFVNSLRGVEHTGKTLRVSRIYEEAAPYYFEDDAALRAHLGRHAEESVQKILAKTERTIINQYEHDIADLVRGTKDPMLDNLWTERGMPAIRRPVATRPNYAIQRLMKERAIKINRTLRRGLPVGTVIVGGEEGKPGKEVE
ncbi:MAG: DUF547 domain-containing protein [Erythrobacter sp.]|uniref:DUF547 domain-containing protein n=1 Tax=Erythrobacter sp. TaxID=1042 RepID=UPI00261EAF59|nr:DUF547 domain-containing protein [Erythrobacter sp.]MDJ0979739.1 DUF547 domain-containing protein [Erythrobacter sp.]